MEFKLHPHKNVRKRRSRDHLPFVYMHWARAAVNRKQKVFWKNCIEEKQKARLEISSHVGSAGFDCTGAASLDNKVINDCYLLPMLN